MYNELKEAIVTYLLYGKRIPLVVAYQDEIHYLLNRKSETGVSQIDTLLESIQRDIIECNKCKNSEKYTICGGDASSGIMIVLNPPSLLSLVEKKLLQPQVDEMLTKMMKAIQVDISTCYITNMIKCESQGELAGAMFMRCQEFLKREIELVKPRIVIVMGEIRPLQRIIKTSSGIQWFNIEHPITLIKNPDLKKPAWNTLKLVRAMLDGK